MLPKHEGKEAEMKKMAGEVVVFEGPDRVGKSTLAQWLVGRIGKSKSRYFHMPNTGPLGADVYHWHHRAEGMPEESRQTLHVAAHFAAVRDEVLPWKRKGVAVIDRWWWSLAVYSKMANVPRDTVDALLALDRLAWKPITPDAIFLVGRGPETELSRGYLRHVHEHGAGPFYFIRNDGKIADAQQQVLEDLRARGWEL